MDNVIQNINIEDIVSSNFQPNQEEQKKIEELANLVKTFGLIDPILVRQKNGRYEIVLGIEKYHAAKLAGLNSVPVIIKDIDDDTFLKYISINQKEIPDANNMKTLPNDFKIPLEKSKENDYLSTDSWKFNNSNDNSDIINLSELNKEEYERTDFKMNNEQMNNNIINNNFEQQTPLQQQPNQGPTFGGRFFPSLEDEPTNMNMFGNQIAQPTLPEVPNFNNNNLIDLTDLSIGKEANINLTSGFEIPNLNSQAPSMNPQINNIVMPQPEFSTSNKMPVQEPIIPQQNNIINLENLQNNNPIVEPIMEQKSNIVPNNEFVNQQPLQPQIDIPVSVSSQPEMVQSMNNIVPPQIDIGINNPTTMSQPEIVQSVNNVVPSQEDIIVNNTAMMSQSEVQIPPVSNVEMQTEPISMDILNADFGAPTPATNSSLTEPVVEETIQVPNQTILNTNKDVTPVTNTIKNLVSNLESFGYKISINEEDLEKTIKLTIEVEK